MESKTRRNLTIRGCLHPRPSSVGAPLGLGHAVRHVVGGPGGGAAAAEPPASPVSRELCIGRVHTTEAPGPARGPLPAVHGLSSSNQTTGVRYDILSNSERRFKGELVNTYFT